MAKKDTNTTTTEKSFNAVAKQHIKYGGKHLKVGDKFEVKESDAKELSDYAEIEIPQEQASGEGGQEGEGEGKGEGEGGGE